MERIMGESSESDRTAEQAAPIEGNNRDAVITRLMELVERQSQQIQQLIQQRDMGGQPEVNVNHDQRQLERVEMVCERFRKLNPPILEGAADPADAEDWLRTVENMFQYSRIPDGDRVLCASFILRGSAGHWWDTIKSIEDVMTMTWERFKELFRNKYFTAPTRMMKMNEFIQLKQGGMSVTDYLRKFEQLSRFAEHMVSTEALKVEKFVEGLRPELYRDVSMGGLHGTTYSQVAERAQIAEQAEIRISQAQNIRRQFQQKPVQQFGRNDRRPMPFQRPKPNFQMEQGHGQGEPNKRPKIDQGKVPPTSSLPMCPNCFRPHGGECHIPPRTCYTCGEKGHMTITCPKKGKQVQQGRAPARVYTLTREEADVNPSVVAGEHDDI